MNPERCIIPLTDAVWQRDPALRTALDGGLLLDFLRTRRWFAGKDEAQTVIFMAHDEGAVQPHWLLGWAEVQPPGGEPQDYLLPLALTWSDEAGERLANLSADMVTMVELGGRVGLLHDAFADDRFCRNLLKMIVCEAKASLSSGWLKCAVTRTFADLVYERPEQWPLRRLDSDSSNTLIVVGERLLLKIYRRLQTGLHPELEMGRFLSEVAAFPHAAPLIGTLEYENEEQGTITALAVLQGLVPHQRDGWRYVQEALQQRRIDKRLALTLGRRTGELHRALAQTTGDPAFDPEPMTPADLSVWLNRIRHELATTLDRLKSSWRQFPEPARSLADRLLKNRSALMAQLENLELATGCAIKTRIHGDLHLGQMLVSGEDVTIIDFEGEPVRTLAARRDKQLPLRDVAGMLRSFNYAAHAALRSRPDDSEFAQWIADWEQQTSADFLAGYAETVNPASAEDSAPNPVFLKWCLLEKAGYELRYELDNRPDWIAIPIRGLCELFLLPPEG